MQNDQDISKPETVLKKQEDFLVANLLDYFRKVEHEEKWSEAARMAKNFIKRSANIESERLDKRLNFLAAQLKNNLTPTSIRLFAQECLKSASKVGNLNHHAPSFSLPKKSNHLQKKALKEIKSSIENGHSEQAALTRAAYGLFREQRTHEQQAKRALSIQQHPLKDTLELLNSAHKPLPREDIRLHLLHLKNHANRQNPGQGMLFTILKKAQAFSALRIHQLIGDELFFLCRPLGFVDKNEQIVEVEVPTSAHLNALTYRKFELLKALKNDPTFKQAQSIRLKVRSSANLL